MPSLWDTLISKGADAAKGVSAALAPAAPPANPDAELRSQHYAEYAQGLTNLGFAEWMAERGGVSQPGAQPVAASVQPPAQPDTRPRTPDFLYRGREQAR